MNRRSLPPDRARTHPRAGTIPATRWPTREEARASLLFSPLALGAHTARTRTWVPAMVPWRSIEEGSVTGDILDWYGRFADGRPGVLVVEATGIRDIQSGPLLRISHDRFIPGLAKLVETVRRRSDGATLVLIQIIDFLTIRRRPEKEKYLRRFLRVRDAHRERLAMLAGFESAATQHEDGIRELLCRISDEELASVLDAREREDLERGYRERVTDMELAHIRELPRVLPGLFAEAARRAEQAGFDGVELHYAHAYTMASFLSRLNDRDDGYGRTREGRVRLPIEVYRATRGAVHPGFTIGCRMLSDEVIDGGSRVDDASYYAVELARAGIDFISISKGGKFEDARQPKVGEAVYPYTGRSGLECMPTVKLDARGPFGRNLPLSAEIRAAVRAAGLRTPIGAAGGINSFELAEQALATGACDFVAAARQSLADPDWWLKMELGRGAEIRRCIYTNYCEALDQRHLQVTCQLWDRQLDEPDPAPHAQSSPGDGATTHPARPAPALAKDQKRRLVPPPWRH